MPKLELLVDSYSPPNSDDPNVPSPEITKGQKFDASKQEAERLAAIGAAVDPNEAQKQREQALEAERQTVEARRAQIDEELAAIDRRDPSKLNSADVNAELSARGLSTEGNLDARRSRLAEAVASET